MDFNIDKLDQAIMNLEKQVSTGVDQAKDASTTAVKDEPLATDKEQQVPITTVTNDQEKNREYCLIIFNNPRWSQHLQPYLIQDKQEQGEQPTNPSTTTGTATTVKSEPYDVDLDDTFIIQLRELVHGYMSRTKRQFPVKYFLNFTSQ